MKQLRELLLCLGWDASPSQGYLQQYLADTYFIPLAPVVETLDSAIHWINLYPVDNAIGFLNTYPLDSDLSGG